MIKIADIKKYILILLVELATLQYVGVKFQQQLWSTGQRFEPHTGCIVVPSETQCATILFAVAESQQINWAKSQATPKKS